MGHSRKPRPKDRPLQPTVALLGTTLSNYVHAAAGRRAAAPYWRWCIDWHRSLRTCYMK